MTFRPPIIVTVYSRPKAADYYNVRIAPLLTPNPALPFRLSDWPLPQPFGKVQASDAPTNQFPFLHPNPPRPFHQDDWYQLAPPARPKAVGEAVGTLSPLLTPNPSRPFHQDEWKQLATPARPKALVDDFVDVLLGQTFFIISQELWDNATLSRPKAKVDDFVNLLPLHSGAVVVTLPFNQNLWENAVLSRPKVSDTSASPPSSLLTPNPSVPFNQNLWEGEPARPKANVDTPVPESAPLYTPNPAAPFTSWDIAVLDRPISAKVDDFVNLLPIHTGTVVVNFPFGPGDWPTPTLPRPKLTDTSFTASLSLFYAPNPPAPFVLWDVTTVDKLRSIQSDVPVNTLPLQGPPPVISPFQQNVWEIPVPGRSPLKSDIFVNLLPLDTAVTAKPFNQSAWENPVLGRQPLKSDIFVNLLSVKAPNPSAPFTSWDIAILDRPPLAQCDEFVNLLALLTALPPPPGGLQITDERHLQQPIDVILMGQQDYKMGESVIEAHNPDYQSKVKVSSGGGGRLSKNDPTFTTKTSKRGYD